MGASATSVFERTPAGALAIKAQSEDVARRLRTLLLTAFAPISKKFAELEQIKSLVQLRAEVPAYFELVQRFGGDANRHIERVAGLLEQATA